MQCVLPVLFLVIWLTIKNKPETLSHLFQVIGHLKFAFLRGNVGLDLRVGVVDDRQEHVEQNEEDEEDVEDEVGRAEDAVCLLQSLEIEVAEDDAEQREAVDNIAVKHILPFICFISEHTCK